MHTSEVEVLGLAIPLTERLTVEEREEMEVLAARANAEGLAESRVKYEAVRVLSETRLGRKLPAWRSAAFENYRSYFDDYPAFEEAVNTLLQPFYAEQDVKKARRQAQALEAAGDVNALSAMLQATDRPPAS